MRATLHVQQNDARNAPGTLNETDEHTSPPKEILGTIDGNEYPTPVQQDCRFDKGENCRITTAIDKNQLGQLAATQMYVTEREGRENKTYIERFDEIFVVKVPGMDSIARGVDQRICSIGRAPVGSLQGISRDLVR